MPLLRTTDLLLYFPLTLVRVAVFCYAAWTLIRDPSDPWWLVLDGIAILLLAPAAFDQASWLALLAARRPPPCGAPPPLSRIAAVTTFVTPAESLEMLQRTLQAMVAMKPPHDTWLLDESDSPDARELCARLGVRHFTRRGVAGYNAEAGAYEAGSKHGNYNAWLDCHGYASYDLLAAFDPDHVPAPGFLAATAGYFSDPGIGYVQAAQAYYNQEASFIARGAAEETYAYYSIVQTASARYGYPVVTGCHNFHRVQALRDAGGFADHPADDLLLTLRYQAKGWKGVYVPQILAGGLAPVDWSGYTGQQFRWARSLIDLKLRRPDAVSRSGPTTRVLSFMQGARYLLDGGLALGVLLLVCLTLVTGNGLVFAAPLATTALLYGILAVTNLYKQRFYLDPSRERGLPWRSWILRFAKWPFTFAAAVSALRNRPVRYVVTPKARSARRPSVLLLPMLTLSAAVVVAWAIGRVTGAIRSWPYDALAAAAALLPLAVAATERLLFPAPYSPGLRPDLSAPAPPPPALTQLAVAGVAVVAALWSMTGAFSGTAAGTDSARHAMNGAFLLDMVRGGHLAQPVEFARWYFNRLPAISIPYHPPLFPAWEAAWYAIFGVDYRVARLSVAVAVAIAAGLFFCLLRGMTGSLAVALLATAALLSLPVSQWVGRDVMLEFPALVFVLWAVHCCRRWRGRFTLGRGIAYGLISAAGIWTKQTIFLPLIPFIDIALSRNWKALLQPGLWVSAAVSVLSAAALFGLAAMAGGSALPQHWAPQTLGASVLYNLRAYGSVIACTALLLVVLGVLAWRRPGSGTHRADERLAAAWLISVVAVLLPLPAYDERYAIYAMAAGTTGAYAVGLRLLQSVAARRTTLAAIAVATCGVLAFHGVSTTPRLTGPELAARDVNSRGIGRVLYLGHANGSFIYSLRSIAPGEPPGVLRGDKLSGISDPDGVAAAARRYGIESVFIEPEAAPEWKQLALRPPASLEFRKRFSLKCFDPRLSGDLLEYRVANPAPSRAGQVRQSIASIGVVAVSPL